MRANCVIPGILVVAAFVGLAMWLAVEHRTRLGLGEEHKALEQQSDQMAGLIARNEEMSNLVTQASRPQSLTDAQSRELLRLRGEAGVLRQQGKELEAVRNENRHVHAALANGLKCQDTSGVGAAATADYWPRDSWAFTGFASPEAALQSSIWAANNGDLKALLASATGDMRKMLDEQFTGKSDDEAAIRAMDEVGGLKSVRVLSREPQGDDTVVLTAAFEDRNETHTSKLLMKKVGNEWKLFGPAD